MRLFRPAIKEFRNKTIKETRLALASVLRLFGIHLLKFSLPALVGFKCKMVPSSLCCM